MLDQMQKELASAGHEVHVLAINENGDTFGDKLVEAASYPLFQDVTKQMAWRRHAGYQDDFYIYDDAGVLVTYLPYGGPVSTDLTDPDDYETVKGEILSAMAQ